MSSTTPSQLLKALRKSWSGKSSTLWRADNPALGNCGVTALVVQDHLGGEILKTKFGDIWHFYNRVDGKRMDFTESQFERPIVYDDIESDRDGAFADTNSEQYNYLSSAVRSVFDTVS